MCTRSSQSRLKHNLSRNTPSRHFYFSRLPRLWNPLNLLSLTSSQAVNSLNHHFWSHFLSTFDDSNRCSFHFQCACSNCVISNSHHWFSLNHHSHYIYSLMSLGFSMFGGLPLANICYYLSFSLCAVKFNNNSNNNNNNNNNEIHWKNWILAVTDSQSNSS